MSSDSWPSIICIILIVIIMIFNALVVASKRALDYIDRNKIKEMIEDDPDNKKLISITNFLSQPSKYHYANHIVAFLNIILAFGLFALTFDNKLSKAYFILALIGFYIVYTALADVFPKKIAAQSSEKTGIALIGFQKFIYYITKPLVFICVGLANIILTIIGKEKDVDDSYFTEDKVMSMLDRGQEKGEINEEGRRMIDSVFEFDDLLAYEIMTPRTDVFMIDLDDDREEYFDELMEMKYSRIPCYEGDPDNIIGILHIKDYLMNASKSGFDKISIKKMLRPAYFVPETKNIDALFIELQKQRHHLAILIDEYGGFSGIVSIEDIIEQIFGDIDDEFDEEDRVIEQFDDDTYIVDGNVYLDDLDDETNVELESENSETIGGFIIDLMGEIPKENVTYKPINYENYEFTILEVKDRRIEKVKITVKPKNDAE